MEEWHNLYVATVGAAAALSGLIFVGISISLSKILAVATLPDRALLSIILLLTILVLSILFLVPNQTLDERGIEVLIIGTIAWLAISKIDIGIYRRIDKQFKLQHLFSATLDQIAVLPYIIGGIEILSAGERGFTGWACHYFFIH